MLVKGWPNVWVYDRYTTNGPSYHIYNNYSHGSLEVYLESTSHFLVLPQYYSTSGGAMKLSFYENLRNYYHNNHYIKDSFHNHVHFLVLVHVHEFGTILHSLQEWFKSNWMRLVISHQKLIILFSNKKTWY